MNVTLQRCAAGVALAISFMSAVQAQDGALATPEQRQGYSVGANIGGGLVQQGVAQDLDLAALVQGIEDAFAGGELKMTPDEMRTAIETLQAQLQAQAQALAEAQAAASRDFLAKNATAEGVKTTDSGLQYLVLTEGADGDAVKPKETDTVTVHYHGTLTDGSVFDSSVERGQPATFTLNEVIAGWTEGVQLMKVGDKYRFFIPSELGYGANGAGPIPPDSTLIFDVELLEVEAGDAAPAP
jgi:FKBP-type peptidyl-prolyl cis-trans isomerase